MNERQPTGRLEGNDLILTRSFRAPIDDVWQSLTDPRSTRKWRLTAGRLTAKAWATTPADSGASRTICRIWRRIGSDRAWAMRSMGNM